MFRNYCVDVLGFLSIGLFREKSSSTLALGAGVGLFTSLQDGIGLKIVMMSIGALAGAAIGGALSHMGRKRQMLSGADEAIPGLGFSSDDRMRRYWLEKGTLTSAPGIPERDEVGDNDSNRQS
jgi:hypothetical protein